MYGEFVEDHEEESNAIRSRAAAYQEKVLAIDKARLDFLEKTGTRYVYAISGVWFFRASEDAVPIKMTDLRTAIDAARKQGGA